MRNFDFVCDSQYSLVCVIQMLMNALFLMEDAVRFVEILMEVINVNVNKDTHCLA